VSRKGKRLQKNESLGLEIISPENGRVRSNGSAKIEMT
jgi:hypothetical protein